MSSESGNKRRQLSQTPTRSLLAIENDILRKNVERHKRDKAVLTVELNAAKAKAAKSKEKIRALKASLAEEAKRTNTLLGQVALLREQSGFTGDGHHPMPTPVRGGATAAAAAAFAAVVAPGAANGGAPGAAPILAVVKAKKEPGRAEKMDTDDKKQHVDRALNALSELFHLSPYPDLSSTSPLRRELFLWLGIPDQKAIISKVRDGLRRRRHQALERSRVSFENFPAGDDVYLGTNDTMLNAIRRIFSFQERFTPTMLAYTIAVMKSRGGGGESEKDPDSMEEKFRKIFYAIVAAVRKAEEAQVAPFLVPLRCERDPQELFQEFQDRFLMRFLEANRIMPLASSSASAPASVSASAAPTS